VSSTSMAIGPWKYGQAGEFRLLVAFLRHSTHKGLFDSTSSGKVDIRHEALANVRMAYINKDPGRIICLIWGHQNILRYVIASSRGEILCLLEFSRNYWN
jgi:hypothetical protein